jgi:hypothetical protein
MYQAGHGSGRMLVHIYEAAENHIAEVGITIVIAVLHSRVTIKQIAAIKAVQPTCHAVY